MHKIIQTQFYLLLLSLLIGSQSNNKYQKRSSCYNQKKQPIKCSTPFVNAAFKLPVQVTNTCGEDEYELFCMQAESTKTARYCDFCDAKDKEKAHPASYLTDNHHDNHEEMTWWQSSTMVENIQHPNSVNLTLNLGKAYIITYIRLSFFSSRPESFAIYKKKGNESEDWVPFQYFSSSCSDTYNITANELITKDNEDIATCREDHSDISPLTGGVIVFSTLEGRPSVYNYQNSTLLQNWVSATDIMVSLNRLNTFGDEVFGDKQVLSQYFYGIKDFAVGGRCKCYGHASECVNDGGVIKCLCQHNTDGVDCQECLPFFNDLPWHSSTTTDAHECKACDCNGLSETCDFDADLYAKTGHGGHCTNCRDSTSGPHCEYCEHGYYHRPEDKNCIYCHCHPLGSRTIQCNDYAVCDCQPGVTGEKCDQCLPNYYNLSATGCSKCSCDPRGVVQGAEDACDTVTGQCHCKEFATGKSCDQCKDGYFGLDHSNLQGCMACFCYGHSGDCSLSPGNKVNLITSTFLQGQDGWMGMGRYGEDASVEHLDVSKEISVVANDAQSYYFTAPEIYLGDLHRSYGLALTFKLRLDNNRETPRPSIEDIVIESANGASLTMSIFGQGNAMPTSETQEFKYLLGEHRDLQWMPGSLSHFEFLSILSNVTALKIRATYTNQGVGFISDISLQTSTPIYEITRHETIQVTEEGSNAVVENCQCPEGYVGQFCEACAPGFRRYPHNSGSFGECVPCQCNGHSDVCEAESGRCMCKDDTKGDNCELCQDGFYGDALNGTENDCQACGCPGGGRCIQLVSTGDLVCLDCPEGYGGLRCDSCTEGYYSDADLCAPCQCNNNTHPNDIGGCDRETGECLKCHYNTIGASCDQCLVGYFGNPTDEPHGMCEACDCFSIGSIPDAEKEIEDNDQSSDASALLPTAPKYTCDLDDGQCHCKPYVDGKKCDTCVNGTWNIYSEKGCEDCMCDPTGSVDENCDVYSGRCQCKPGIGGLKCNKTLALHFGFTIKGALECQCDPYGSNDAQCDVQTGQCSCKPKYRGRKCDQCEMNRFDLRRGCVECPVCYNIIMEEADKVNEQIEQMRNVFKQAQNLPVNFFEDDSEYKELEKVMGDRLEDLENSMGSNQRADELKWYVKATKEMERLDTVYSNITDNTQHLPSAIGTNKGEIVAASEMLESFQEELTNLTAVLDSQKKDLLGQIKERQIQSGRQSEDLTNVAKEAREVVADLELKLEEIHEKLRKATNVSVEIISVHQNWSSVNGNLEEKTHALTNLNALMTEKYNNVKNETVEAVDRVKSLLNESEVLLAEITNLEVPDVDSDSINTTSLVPMLKAESQKAEGQHKALENLTAHFTELQRNLTYLLSDTTVALADRKGLDNVANDAYNRSMNAWKKVEDVFTEANKILETFKTFDQKINESRLKSEEAEDSVGDTEEKYPKEISEKIHETHVNMMGPSGEVQADDLEYHNLGNLRQIHNLTQDLEKLEKEFGEVENSTNIIAEFVSEVDKQLDEVEGELDDLEMQNHNETLAVEELDDILLKIQNMIAEANNISVHTNQEADQLLEYFEHSLDPIEEEKMKTASLQIEKFSGPAEAIIENPIFENLQSDLEKIKNVTDQYTEELKQFEYDVTNLEAISSTIPTKCFKPVALEPTYKEE